MRLTQLIGILKEHHILNKEGKMNSGVFADSIGLDPSQFSKIKSGEVGITLEKIMEISSIYNVSIEWMITGKGEALQTSSLLVNDPVATYKTTGTEVPADTLLKVREELIVMRLSFDRLLKIVGVQPGKDIPEDPQAKEDLSLDKKARFVKEKDKKGNQIEKDI